MGGIIIRGVDYLTLQPERAFKSNHVDTKPEEIATSTDQDSRKAVLPRGGSSRRDPLAGHPTDKKGVLKGLHPTFLNLHTYGDIVVPSHSPTPT